MLFIGKCFVLINSALLNLLYVLSLAEMGFHNDWTETAVYMINVDRNGRNEMRRGQKRFYD